MHSESLRHLVATLLATSSDIGRSDQDKTLDSYFDIYNVDPASLLELELEFRQFVRIVAVAIASQVGGFDSIEDFYLRHASHAFMLEHDYIMTRNRHGAGFWDGDWDPRVSEILTSAANLKPEIEPYVGDDSLIYF